MDGTLSPRKPGEEEVEMPGTRQVAARASQDVRKQKNRLEGMKKANSMENSMDATSQSKRRQQPIRTPKPPSQRNKDFFIEFMRKISALPCLIARANGTCYDACRSRSNKANPLQRRAAILTRIWSRPLAPDAEHLSRSALVVTSTCNVNFYGRLPIFNILVI